MSLWNYLGEFFLFRWLFGSHERKETKHDVPDTAFSIDDSDSEIGLGSRYDTHDYGYSQSYDDFLDEQEDYDMMDEDF